MAVTEDEFWALIERSRSESGGVLGRQVQLLREHLLASGRNELLALRDSWDEADVRVFTWPVWDASCLLLGGVGDDFFGDIRAWIVSHGREIANRIVVDPDSLVELADDTHAVETGDAEHLNMLAMNVRAELTGNYDLPSSQMPAYGPTGDRTELKDGPAVIAHFPRLAEFAGITGVQD